jgi:hypothetical protein
MSATFPGAIFPFLADLLLVGKNSATMVDSIYVIKFCTRELVIGQNWVFLVFFLQTDLPGELDPERG